MRKHLIYLLSLSTVLLSGCLFDDQSDCPTDNATALRLHLSYNEGSEASGVLPIERADFYLFDANHHFVCSLTDVTGPFTTTYQRTLALPAGTYTLIAWANLDNSLATLPASFTAEETTLDDARLTLNSLSQETSATTTGGEDVSTSGPQRPLYHAMEQSVRIVENQTTDLTLPLHRNTKDIRLTVSFYQKDGTLCEDPSHQPSARIYSTDGILRFDNTLLPCPAFAYTPATQDNSTAGSTGMLFHKMALRLHADEPRIVINTPATQGEATPFYSESLMKLLAGTGYATQEALDGRHVYNIVLRFTCPHGTSDTHTTVRIWVNGWEYVDMGGGV